MQGDGVTGAGPDPGFGATSDEGLARRALALSIGPAVGIGLARFGYAVLLPAMRADLGWTYTQAGSMNTANAIGYLGGALISAPLATRYGTGRMFRQSILWTAASMFLSGLTGDFVALLVLRVAAGIGGAVALITGATLAARMVAWGRHATSGMVIGLYFGGVGMGIAVMGLGIPVLLAALPEAWRHVWVAMGLLALAGIVPAGRASRGVPGEPGAEVAVVGRRTRAPIVRAVMAPSLMAYFLFGLGYITYMTFAVAFLGEQEWGPWGLSVFWLVLGGSTFVSGFLWPRVLSGFPAGRSLAVRLGVLSVGCAVPLLTNSAWGVLASAVLFGGSFLSVVGVVTDVVRRGLEPQAWSAGIALFTVSFSMGQTLGPIASGALADVTGGLSSGFALSTGVLVLSLLVALFQREVARVA